MTIIADLSIDDAHFKHIKPGDLNNWTRIAPRFGVTGGRLKDAAFEAVCLANSAREFFAGYFPTPAYFADEMQPLPWCDEYHIAVDANTWTCQADLIAAGVRRVAVELGPVDVSADYPNTYNSKALCGSERTILQSLAVETMLLADGCIDQLLQAKVVGALPWLCAAYRRLFDCVGQARVIVDLEKSGTQDQVAPQKVDSTSELRP